MFPKPFSGVRLAILGAAIVFLTAEPTRAFPPGGPPRLPRYGGYGGQALHFGSPYALHYGFPFALHGSSYRPYYRGYGMHAPYSYSPYYGNSYGQYTGGYGDYSPSYGYSPDPSFSGYGSASNSSAKPANFAEDNYLAALLAAGGVPAEEGRPAWPLALRVLPGQEAQALRGQIDRLLQIAAAQAAQGSASTGVVQELAQSTNHLRKLLLRHREEHGGLAEHSYEEARRFLDKMAGVPKLLRNS